MNSTGLPGGGGGKPEKMGNYTTRISRGTGGGTSQHIEKKCAARSKEGKD